MARTKEELLERARELDIEGRSGMNKEELEKAVSEAEAREGDESLADKDFATRIESDKPRTLEDATGLDEERVEEWQEAQEQREERQDRQEALDEAVVDEGEESADRQRKLIEKGDPSADVDAELALSHHQPDADPEVVGEHLSGSEEEALEHMGEAQATEADLSLSTRGPNVLKDPAQRIMTGAVNEAHAKEQKKLLKDALNEDYRGGDISETGQALAPPLGEEKTAADVIDYQAQLDRINSFKEEGDKKAESGETVTEQAAVAGTPFGTGPVVGGSGRHGVQKAVFYTDGLSHEADANLERAYEIPERMQSNDPDVREAGDVSLSEAAREAKSDEEKALKEDVMEKDDNTPGRFRGNSFRSSE